MHKTSFNYNNIAEQKADKAFSANMLVDVVTDVANNVLAHLGQGLPKSVYQLMLCRQLAELGIMLESEQLLCGMNCADNDIIVLDRCVSIACVAGNDNKSAIQCCQLAMSDSAYPVTLVIAFADCVNLYPIPSGTMLTTRH